MLVFIVKSTIFLCVAYLLYMTLLTRENAPVFKRFYLLSGILFSAVIPFVEFDVNTPVAETISPIAVNRHIDLIYAEAEILPDYSESHFFAKWIFFIVYITISGALLLRYIMNIIRLIRLKRNKPGYLYDGCQIVLVDNCSPPYSFINTIYINKDDYINGEIRKEILIHEAAHIRQRHSVDILLVEFWQIVFWFNPFLWLYKREIRLNHEYLADRLVINSEIDVQDYQNLMLNAVFRNSSSFLVSGYDYLFIKKRLVMLTKRKSLFRIWSKEIILVLMISLFSIAISSNNAHIPNMKTEAELWSPVMRQYNSGLWGYNNWNNIFEIEKGNVFIVNDIDTIVFNIMKNDYMIFGVDTASSYQIFCRTTSGNVRNYKLASDTAYLTNGATDITVYMYGRTGDIEKQTLNYNKLPTNIYRVQNPDILEFVNVPVNINSLERGIKK